MTDDINKLTGRQRIWMCGEGQGPLADAVDEEVRQAMAHYLAGMDLGIWCHTGDDGNMVPSVYAYLENIEWSEIGIAEPRKVIEPDDLATLILDDRHDKGLMDKWEAIGKAILRAVAEARAATQSGDIPPPSRSPRLAGNSRAW